MQNVKIGDRVRLVGHSVKHVNGRVGTVTETAARLERPDSFIVRLDVAAPAGGLAGEEWLSDPHELQPEYALEMQYSVSFTNDQGGPEIVKLWAPNAHAALEAAPGTRNKKKRAAFFARVYAVEQCGSRKYPVH